MSELKSETKKRGRKPIDPDQERRRVRYIKCQHCEQLTEYDYKIKQRDRVVDPNLSPKSKSRIYQERHKTKNKKLLSDTN